MDSFKSILITLAIVAIFAYCVLSFGGLLQINNGVSDNNSIFNDPILKSFNSSLNSQLNDFKSSSESQENASAYEQAKEQNPSGALVLGSVFTSLGRFSGFILGFGKLFLNLLGYLIQDKLILGILISILIIVMIASFWRWVKWGQ